jgi:hypothetical protein
VGRVALRLARRRAAVKNRVEVVQTGAGDVRKVVVCRAFLGIFESFEVVVEVVKGAF